MGPLDDEGSSSSMKICNSKKGEAGKANDEVPVQADMEQVDRHTTLSHDADQVVREAEQDQEGCWHLNSNSNYDLNGEEPRVHLNGNTNTPVTLASLKSNEYGAATTKHGFSGVDVEEMDDTDNNQGLKTNSLKETNFVEGVKGPTKPNLHGGKELLLASNNMSFRSKLAQVNSGSYSGVAPQPTNCEVDVHKVQKGEELGNDVAASSSLRSRTITAQLSGNGYSEEMAKIYQSGLPMVDEERNKCHSSSGGNNPDVPPGFSPQKGEKSDGDSTEANSLRKRNAIKQLHVQSTKRVTRSQSKQGRGPVSKRQSILNHSAGKGRMEGILSEGDSAHTTESLRNLANEALAISEVLGIKVIDKRENAIRSITRSLKNNEKRKRKRTWKFFEEFNRTAGGHGF